MEIFSSDSTTPCDLKGIFAFDEVSKVKPMPRKTRLRVALAQVSPKLGNLSSNIELHCEWVDRARAAGADLVIFPELSLTGYILQDLVSDLAIPASEVSTLHSLLERSQNIACIFGYVEVSDNFNFCSKILCYS